MKNNFPVSALTAMVWGRMRFRYLRFAFSAVCGVVCLLLIVLWIDSYWSLRYIDARYYRLQVMAATLRGIVGFDVDMNQTSSGPGTGPKVYWRFDTFPASKRNFGLVTDKLRVISFLGFRWVSANNYYEADLPFWLLTFTTAAISVTPWLRWSKHFSLRTLLIATTLVAVVLGLICYAVR
jgi:hypothetical protein